jgi:hypothetical protein
MMWITKSNKHKLSLDFNNMNEIDGCTLITLVYTDEDVNPIKSDSQVSHYAWLLITPYVSCFGYCRGHRQVYWPVARVFIVSNKPTNSYIKLNLNS